MKFFARKIYQRVNLLGLSILLAISSIGAAVPIFLSQTANAAPGVVYTPTAFDNLSLVPDRTAPSGGYNTTGGVLTENVDNTIATPSSTFYQTEGLQGTLTSGSSIKAQLHIESDWSGKKIEAGLWGITNDASGDPAWPIIQYYSDGVATPSWRVFDTINGGWTTIGDAPTNDSWVNLEITFNTHTNSYDYYIGDSTTPAISMPASDGSDIYSTFKGVIFDNYNFATGSVDGDYSVQWQGFNSGVTQPDAPTNLVFQDGPTTIPSGTAFNTTTTTNNTDLVWTTGSEATDAYQTQITYPNGDIVTQWTSTKNLWIGHTPYLDNLFGERGDGVYSYQVKARSAVTGLWSDWSNSVNLIYDTTAPVVTVTPVAGSLLHGTETFHITVTDADLNPATLKHIWVYLYNNNPPQKSQGASVDLSTGSADFTVNTANLADGLATLDVGKLFDSAGNASGTNDSYFKNYTIDNTAPAVPTLLSPIDGIHRTTADTNSSSWSVVTDPNGPVTYYYESAFDSAFTHIAYGPHAQTTTTILNPGEPEGTYYWRVMACDSLGNCSAWSTPWTINIDNTAPTGLANLSPSNGIVTTTTGLTSIDWTDASDTSGPVSYYYESSHSSVTNSDGSFVSPVYTSGALSSSQISTTGTPEGVYYWHVRAVDALGNSTSWTTPWKVIVDNTAPVVNILTPLNGSILKGNVTVSGTVVDANPDHYYFVVKDSHSTVVAGPGTVNQATVANWTWNTKLVADGTYTVDLEARDAANNKDTSSIQTVTVTVDNTAPTVTIDTYNQAANVIQPTVIATDNSTPLTYAWTTTVADSDVSISDPSVAEPSFTVHTDGTYSFNLTVTDAAGNSSVKTFTFTYTTPVITPTVDTTSTTSPTTPAFTGVSTTDGTTGTTTPATDNSQAVLGSSTQKNASTSTNTSDVKGASTKKSDNAGTLWGLAWYWWALIFAAIIAIIWRIIAAIRRRNAQA